MKKEDLYADILQREIKEKNSTNNKSLKERLKVAMQNRLRNAKMKKANKRHVTGLGEKFCNYPGTDFFDSTLHLVIIVVSCFVFFITLLLIIFSNSNRINLTPIDFLFGRQIIFSDINPVTSFFLEMVSCYFKILKLIVILNLHF